jgi:hypothetical protein
MIHGLLFWLDDWESLKFGPDQYSDFVRTKFEYGP